MRGRDFRRRRESAGPDDLNQQPGLPEQEARLLDVTERDGAAVILLDDGSALEMAPNSVPAGLPASGELLTPELVAALRLAAERKQVARLVFAMLDRRLQPVARIRDKVLKKGYSEAAIDAVLEQMDAKGLYSDRKYAEAYCRDCLASRAVGRRYLVARLREKRVAASVATAAADETLDRGMEQALADRAALARWDKIRDPWEWKNLAKVVRHLQGRGFDPGTANRAARAMRPDRPDDPED